MTESNKSIRKYKPDYYPDLKDSHYYTVNDDVIAHVKNGQITISDTASATSFIKMSEWDFGTLVEAWLEDQFLQRQDMDTNSS